METRLLVIQDTAQQCWSRPQVVDQAEEQSSCAHVCDDSISSQVTLLLELHFTNDGWSPHAGADPAIIKAMAEAAKKSSHDGHDSNGHLVDALAALQKHGHDEASEEHHSGGLFGLFGH